MKKDSQFSLFDNQRLQQIWSKIEDEDFIKFLDKLKGLSEEERELVHREDR